MEPIKDRGTEFRNEYSQKIIPSRVQGGHFHEDQGY